MRGGSHTNNYPLFVKERVLSAETVPATAGHVAAAGDELRRLADEYVDDLARRHPDTATELGDHRFDELLPDRSEAALADERRVLDGFAGRLTDLDVAALQPELRVDAALMAGDVARRLFEIEELREHTWNPLLANPGQAIYMLLAGTTRRCRSGCTRWRAGWRRCRTRSRPPGAQLGPMPQVHLETAIAQFSGTIALVTGRSTTRSRRPTRRRPRSSRHARPRWRPWPTHRDWLPPGWPSPGGRRPDGFADPRIGPELFSRKLVADPAARRPTRTRSWPGPRPTWSGSARRSPSGSPARRSAGTPARGARPAGRGRARRGDHPGVLRATRSPPRPPSSAITTWSPLYDDPVELIDMPEINRGVAVAYCDPPGPLEPAPLPTFIAVSPTPADWPAERVASFYREYNRHMVHNLMVHEAMPGHYLQLAALAPVHRARPGDAGRAAGRARSSRAGRSTPRS